VKDIRSTRRFTHPLDRDATRGITNSLSLLNALTWTHALQSGFFEKIKPPFFREITFAVVASRQTWVDLSILELSKRWAFASFSTDGRVNTAVA